MSIPLLELMEGARKCVRDFVAVQKGENVLIVTDISGFADPLVVEAVALACEEAGANIVTASAKGFNPRVEEPPKILQAAFFAADTVLDIGAREATFESRTGKRAIFEYGVKIINIIAHTRELLASEWARFPIELHIAILKKVDAQVRSGKRIRVVSPNGTDISATISPAQIIAGPRDEFGNPVAPPKGSPMSMWPLGPLGLQPMPPANGTIVYDALLGFQGMLKEPVVLTVEDNWVTRIEGGAEARWFQKLIEEKKQQGNKWADCFVEIMWGLNPKASIQRGLQFINLREAELTRRAGTLHFGIGKLGAGFHWDGILVKPFSVLVDGEPVIDQGRLRALDDPGVREVARKYGDPDKLLTEMP